MSQELTLNASLSFAKGNVQAQAISISSNSKFDVTGTKYAEGDMSVPTTAGGTAIPLGTLASATLGWAFFKNVDTTNYIEILVAVSGAVIAKLKPGEFAFFRIGSGITAPAALANTAAAQLQFMLIEA